VKRTEGEAVSKGRRMKIAHAPFQLKSCTCVKRLAVNANSGKQGEYQTDEASILNELYTTVLYGSMYRRKRNVTDIREGGSMSIVTQAGRLADKQHLSVYV